MIISARDREKPSGKIDSKTIYFARYGNTNPVKQVGYTTNEEDMSFHTPPARYGFYAFVWPEIERFLLSGRTYKIDKDRFETNELRDFYQYKKDQQGGKIPKEWILELYKEEYPNQEKSLQEFIQEYKEKNLRDIEADRKEIEEEKQKSTTEEWKERRWDYSVRTKQNPYELEVKKPKIFTYTGDIWSHLEDYVKNKAGIKARKGSWILTDFATYREAVGKAIWKTKLQNYSKDHLEVFIERL
jgi:hypothetical protein